MKRHIAIVMIVFTAIFLLIGCGSTGAASTETVCPYSCVTVLN